MIAMDLFLFQMIFFFTELRQLKKLIIIKQKVMIYQTFVHQAEEYNFDLHGLFFSQFCNSIQIHNSLELIKTRCRSQCLDNMYEHVCKRTSCCFLFTCTRTWASRQTKEDT